jgi:hypothetical protein
MSRSLKAVAPVDELARQARIMVDAGDQCVYVVDSAGVLILAEAQTRVAALVKEIGADTQVGFHGHQNLSLGIANSVLAVRAAPARSTVRCARSAPARGTRRPRFWSPRSNGWASSPAWR